MQEDVLEVLKEEPNKWFTFKELSERLEARKEAVSKCVNNMKKWDQVLVERHMGGMTLVKLDGRI